MAATQERTIPMFEGYTIKKHALNFGGNVEITDLDVIEKLTLGAEVSFIVTGRIGGRSFKPNKAEEGLDGAAASATLLIDQVELA